MKPNNDYIWRTVFVTVFFFLMGLFSGHHSPHWGLAAGTAIGGVGIWLYRKLRRA